MLILDPSQRPAVAIIVLNWRKPAGTLAYLESLSCTDFPDVQIILLGSGSTDSTVQAIPGRFPDVSEQEICMHGGKDT